MEIVYPRSGPLGEFINAAQAHDFGAGLVFPDRQRCPPIPITANRPVARVLQPVAKAPVSQMIRDPGRQLIIFHQPLPKGFNPHKPGRNSLIDERGLAPPAEGITVLDRTLVNELFCLFELPDDFGVGFFDVQARKIPDIRGKPAVIIDRVHQGNTRLLAGIKILFPKGRGHMDDTGPVFGGHMLGLDDPKSAAPPFDRQNRETAG